MTGQRAVLAVLAGCMAALSAVSAADDDARQSATLSAPAAAEYREEQLAGWTCHVSPRLYEPEHEAIRSKALRLIGNQLEAATLQLSDELLVELRKVPVWVDLDSPLRSAQYHPSADWLRDHGHKVEMAKAVHVPDVRYFCNARHQNEQPWAMMHELAHAYHDRVLGFENERIETEFQRAKAAGLYDSVLHVVGDERRHYALTNAKEFFAEMSEAYLGANDFYPFVRGELKRHDLRTYELLESTWGKLPR